ncbi:MAG: DNA recombination protein RmuC [Bacteroidales bacterium]|jgi:DNA recombination protein RmuC|nr:DNA recombination protein RmuC [Bacteroidales bacterium]
MLNPEILNLIIGVLLGMIVATFLWLSMLFKEKRIGQLSHEKLQRLENQKEVNERAWQDKLDFINQKNREMSDQFRLLAEGVLEEKGKKIDEISSRNITRLLEPFQIQLKQFGAQSERAQQYRMQDAAQLKAQIEQLTQLNQQISTDAINLTKALKGQSQTQGYWGEMILEKVLEQSGLIKGEHYHSQLSLEDHQQQRFRPDAVVHLPGKKDLVIDAKVSLSSYEMYCSADSEAMRQEAGQAHLRSVKAHLKELNFKDYSGLPLLNTIDLVLMFIPVEGAFSLALQQDSNLFSQAFDQGIVVVSPTTLFATLRTIENTWKREAQDKNAREIARKAGLLYDKFSNFLKDMDRVEKSIKQSERAYFDARAKLTDGQGNIIRKTEELRELGARTSKNLPENWVE